MATETWFRNPDAYIRELVECGESKIAWDRGLLVKKRIDPDAHASLYFGRAYPWRVLLVGEQGTAELDADHDINRPKAVYPTWMYGEDLELLEDMLANPAGESQEACLDNTVSADERPVFRQEHRVVITQLPSGATGPGRAFIKKLKEIQEDYPDAIIHVHGLYSYKFAFGLGFRSVDVEPRAAAKGGKVHLPSGNEEHHKKVAEHPQWAAAMGFKPVDLEIPRNRCLFNIKSAVWAGQHYMELYKFKTKGDKSYKPDITSSDASHKPATTASPFTTSVSSKEGDRFLCNTCSLQNQCKYYRNGSVCTVPGAEPVELSKFFGSRNADTIIDGMGILMSANTKRLQRGLSDEETFDELNPEVTKMMSQIFEQAAKLAKMIDPARFAAPKVNINVGANGSTSITSGNPRAFVAEAVRALELQGIRREDITPEMIQGVMEGMVDPDVKRRALEPSVMGEVISNE